jgi:hypothetical protein
VLVPDLDWREDAGHGARSQDHVGQNPIQEPMFRGPFDRGRDALEGNLELLDTLDVESVGKSLADFLERLEMGTGPSDRRDPTQQRTGGDPRDIRVAPEVAETPNAPGGGIGSEEGAVDRAHGSAEDDVGFDRALSKRTQHPDLVRPQDPASAKHEGDLAGTSVACHVGVLPR